MCVDGVQVAGQSARGQLPAWKQFHVMRIVEVRVLEAQFTPAPDYDPASEKYELGLIASA